MRDIGTKTLETKRLTLRRFQKKDFQEMFSHWCSDDEVTKYLSWQTHPSIKETKRVLNIFVDSYASPHTYRWIIIEKTSNEAIGSIDTVNVNVRDENAEIGYCIGSKYWGKGYLTEALKEVCRYLFEEVGVNRVEAKHVVGNDASGRVMEKAGMLREGLSKGSHKDSKGCFLDMVHYGMTKNRFDKLIKGADYE